MSEEKKVNETKEEAKKDETVIDADVKEQADGTQKAVEHVGIGQKIWNGVCFVGRGVKKAAPYVLAFGAGAGAFGGFTYFLGKKADQESIEGQTQELIPEKTEESDNQ